MPVDISWYQEAERRGLINKLSQEQQDWWAEAKRRGLTGQSSSYGETQPQAESPGIIEGSIDTAKNAFAFGQGSRMAGLENTGIGKVSKMLNVINPKGAIDAIKSLTKEDFDPSNWGRQYEEGKRDFEQKQQAFKEEHPVASGIAEVGGTLAGLAIPAGAIGGTVRGVVAGTRGARALGGAGRIGARIAGEATAFGTYEGIRGGFGEGRADVGEAIKGFEKGSVLGLAFGIIGGAVQAAETPLINWASKSLGQKVAEGVVKSAGLATEGVTIGAAPSLLEGETPTAKDIGTGLAFVAGGRALAKGLSKAGEGVRKLATEYSEEELQNLKQRAEQFQKAEGEVKTATENLQQAEVENQRLQGQLKDVIKTAEGEEKAQLQKTLQDAQKTEDWYRAELDKAQSNYVSLQEQQAIKGVKKTAITPSEEQVQELIKFDKNLDENKARIIARDMNKREAFKQATEAPKTFRQKVRDFVENVRTEFNIVRPLERIEENFKRITGDALDYAKRASVTLYKLANGGEFEAMSRPVVDAIKESLKENPTAMDGYKAYSQAKKAIQFGKGTAEDLEIVNAFKNDKAVLRIDESVRKMNQEILDGLYDAGRIDDATYNQWKKNDYYVPSRIVKEYVGDNAVISRELDAFTKKYEGTGLLYEDSAVASLIQGKSLHRFSEMNKAKQQLVEAGRKTGDITLYDSGLDYKGGPINFNRNNQILVWEKGKPQIWNVPEKVAKYFNPEPMREPGRFTKTLGTFMNLYKGGTTATSLGFSYSNLFRDVQQAVIGSKYGGYIGVDTIRNSAKELAEGTKLAQWFRKEQGGKTILTSEQIKSLGADSIRDAAEALANAETAFRPGTQRDLLANMFTATLPKYTSKLKNVTGKSGRKALEVFTYAGQLGEETTRFSVFKSVLEGRARNKAELNMWLREPNKIPKSVLAEAGNEAREVTLNFNKQMAPWVESANRYFLPYFKPSILGAMRGFEVLTNPEISKRAWRTVMNIGILQGLISGRIGSEEDLKKLEAVNNKIAGKTFLLQDKTGRLYTFPMSQEFGPLAKIFAGATEAIYRGVKGKPREDILREIGTAAKEELANIIPVGGYISPSNMVIQPAKPFVEQAINKELYTGVPIEPEYLKNLPPSMRYTQSTSKTLISLANWASNHGVEISPMRMQHLAKSTVSSTGKELLALSDTALATLISTDLRPRQDMENNPLVRRFMADIYAPYSQISEDARKIVDDNKPGYTAIEKKEIDEESPRGKRYLKQAYIYESIKEYADEMNNIYKERKELLEDLRYTGEDNRLKYENGEWSREKLLRENDKAMMEAEGALTYYKEELRELELAIIEEAKLAEKEYKKTQK